LSALIEASAQANKIWKSQPKYFFAASGIPHLVSHQTNCLQPLQTTHGKKMGGFGREEEEQFSQQFVHSVREVISLTFKYWIPPFQNLTLM
jgi:hypothetical protein